MLTINNGWQFKQSYLDQNSTNELLTNTTFCMYTLKTYSQNKLDLAMSKVKVTTSCYISRFPGQMSRKFQVFQENYWAFYLVSLMEKINMLDRSYFFLLIHIFEKAEFYGSNVKNWLWWRPPPPYVILRRWRWGKNSCTGAQQKDIGTTTMFCACVGVCICLRNQKVYVKR